MRALLAAAGWAVRFATSTTSFAYVLLPLLFTLSSKLIPCSRSDPTEIVLFSINQRDWSGQFWEELTQSISFFTHAGALRSVTLQYERKED